MHNYWQSRIVICLKYGFAAALLIGLLFYSLALTVIPDWKYGTPDELYGLHIGRWSSEKDPDWVKPTPEFLRKVATFEAIWVTGGACLTGLLTVGLMRVIKRWRRSLLLPSAAPNGGPAASVDSSTAPGGPPSVS